MTIMGDFKNHATYSSTETTPRQEAPGSRLRPLDPSPWYMQIMWFNLLVVTATPLVSVYGILTTAIQPQTFAFCVFYFFVNMIGITAGYHRLWSHRAYTASRLLQYFLALAGVGGVQGSILWWSRHHRAHHRYTDTERDPYDATQGFWWSHLGWMLIVPRVKPGRADVSDLKKDPIVRWQHTNFFLLAFIFGLLLPAILPGLFWRDWRGGVFFAGFLRLACVHHAVFSINSVAHWLGDATYNDKKTPRDSFLTAFLTLGEGYHNFHHQFPMDYRNAVMWYQWDPTKWFIWMCSYLGLAWKLRRFPETEIKKGVLSMRLKKIKTECDGLLSTDGKPLPEITLECFEEHSKESALILISGFIVDVEEFMDNHPGGRSLLEAWIGKDGTAAFFGGVYDHSDAAQNLLATMRTGVLPNRSNCDLKYSTPPWKRLRVVGQC